MKLYELQSGVIDKKLKDTAKDVEKNDGSEAMDKRGGPMGDDAAADDTEPNEPEGALGMEDSEDDPDNKDAEDKETIDKSLKTKVDDYILAVVRTMPYANHYNFEEGSKIHPFSILQMDTGTLENLKLMVRNQINLKNFSGQNGIHDPHNEDGVGFYQDLLTYVEKVLELKNKERTKKVKEHFAKVKGRLI